MRHAFNELCNWKSLRLLIYKELSLVLERTLSFSEGNSAYCSLTSSQLLNWTVLPQSSLHLQVATRNGKLHEMLLLHNFPSIHPIPVLSMSRESHLTQLPPYPHPRTMLLSWLQHPNKQMVRILPYTPRSNHCCSCKSRHVDDFDGVGRRRTSHRLKVSDSFPAYFSRKHQD